MTNPERRNNNPELEVIINHRINVLNQAGLTLSLHAQILGVEMDFNSPENPVIEYNQDSPAS